MAKVIKNNKKRDEKEKNNNKCDKVYPLSDIIVIHKHT